MSTQSGNPHDPAAKPGFWRSLPGTITAVAGLLVAVGTLITVLCNTGVVCRDRGPSTPDTTQSVTDTVPPPRPAAEFMVVEAFLHADPTSYEGPCPVIIGFSGRISVVGGSGTVTYRFIRSDNGSAPVQSLTFDGPGSQSVQTTWRLGAEGTRWQAIKILDQYCPVVSRRKTIG